MQVRSLKAVKNIVASMFFKGGSILISLVLVPLTLSYLNPYEYGVWLTLSSILTWVYLFDIGLGNGLRNKLTEALAKKDFQLARIYVSTTFVSLLLLVVFLYLLFLCFQMFLDWNKILNVDPNKIAHINSIVTIVFAFFCTSFVLKTIGNIYMAYQEPAVNDLLALLGSLISLLLIYLCTLYTEGSLDKVAVIYSGAPVMVYLVAYPITFWRYKEIKPSFSFVRFSCLKDLLSLGLQFFVIQVACLILFMTSNFIISQMFGPDAVTPYNIAFKYFSLINIGFTIVITPIWSAVTDAYAKNEMVWIRNAMKKIVGVWMIGVCLAVIMLLLSEVVYSIWIGDEIQIPFVLSAICAVYVSISNWNNIFAYFINGVGKIRMQLYSSIFTSILFIPLAYFLGQLIGVAGVLLALCICLMVSAVWSPIQYWKIVNRKDTGIWSK